MANSVRVARWCNPSPQLITPPGIKVPFLALLSYSHFDVLFDTFSHFSILKNWKPPHFFEFFQNALNFKKLGNQTITVSSATTNRPSPMKVIKIPAGASGSGFHSGNDGMPPGVKVVKLSAAPTMTTTKTVYSPQVHF